MQGITVVSILTAFSMTISTMVLTIASVIVGGGGPASFRLSPPKALEHGQTGWQMPSKELLERLLKRCLLV